MSGAPVPVYIVVEPFAKNAALLGPLDPGGATLPIPVPSQVGVVAGAASFDDGFPAATMVDPEDEGGVPAFGQDFNGLMFTVTAYLALMQAGQLCTYNAAASTAFAGYAIGAKLASTTPGRVWTNWVDGNTNNPDVTPTGWASSDPLAATIAPAAGTQNNLVLPGPSDYALDIDTTAGNVDVSGFVAQRNGQKIYVSNTGANLLQVLALNAGSTITNRVRAASDLGIVQNQTLTLQYFTALSRWLLV